MLPVDLSSSSSVIAVFLESDCILFVVSSLWD